MSSKSNIKHLRKRCRKIREFLILCLPACLFLAAFPQLRIGQTTSMNLEISLPEIWLVCFPVASLLNLPKIWQKYRQKFLCSAIFPAYATLSVLWSTNPLRAFLTAVLIWLIWFSIWNLVLTFRRSSALYRQKFQTVFLATSALFAGVCWLQCILDLAGFGRDTSLLCLGCTSATFGFPHPNGLTLEPQFMGNLLLAPAFFTLTRYLQATETPARRSYLALFAFFSATLFLTFSRGAIYAFLVGVVFQLVLHLYQNRTVGKIKFGSSFLTICVIIISFMFTLTTQGIMAALGPTSDDFISGATKSLHHLTLGRLDLRPEALKNPLPAPLGDDLPETGTDGSMPQYAPESGSESVTQAVFSGYIAESTDIRVNLTNYAFDRWNDSPQSIFFGTGLGSAGTSLYHKFPEQLGTAKEIVQNQYASLLLELGIFGYLALAIGLFPFVKKITGLELAYLCTLGFFSGLPNAFHLYLLPPVIHSCDSQSRQKS